MSSRSPDLPEVLALWRAGIMRDLRVALPGKVLSFDSATCTCDVQAQVKETSQNNDGTTSQTSLPVFTGVPVMFPGGGGLRITFPVAAGDFVWVMFGDRSLDAWLDQGQESGPEDQRRHALSDAVCYPGIMPTNTPWTNIEAGVITLGQDSAGSSDFVALAAKTKNEISALRDTVNSLTNSYNGLQSAMSSNMSLISTHVHVVAGTAAAAAPALVPIASNAGSSATGPAAVGDVKSETVKVRG